MVGLKIKSQSLDGQNSVEYFKFNSTESNFRVCQFQTTMLVELGYV